MKVLINGKEIEKGVRKEGVRYSKEDMGNGVFSEEEERIINKLMGKEVRSKEDRKVLRSFGYYISKSRGNSVVDFEM